MKKQITLYRASLLHTPVYSQVDYIRDGVLAVEEGRIVFAGEYSRAILLYPTASVVAYSGAILLPGFIDSHVHLPQWSIAGVGRGELLHWLETYVFPAEARFADTVFAHEHALAFFRAALAVGTTAMAVYSSSHYHATNVAFQVAAETGIRALIGRAMMDRNAPAELLSDTDSNIAESLRLASDWHGYDNGRLRYVLTPRFALSCTPELLHRCGDIARSEGLPVQTHLAENPEELRAVASAFPYSHSYADVYNQAGLLGERTIVAHCLHLLPQERLCIKEQRCAIAHCPSSNRFLQSGVMPLQEYLHSGMRLSLGTDVGAGYSLSMLREACEAIESSKTWNILHRSQQQEVLTPEQALWLATKGGADALGIDDTVGDFSIGKEADFLVVDTKQLSPQPNEQDTPSVLLARLMYCASLPITHTFVRGQLVYSQE